MTYYSFSSIAHRIYFVSPWKTAAAKTDFEARVFASLPYTTNFGAGVTPAFGDFDNDGDLDLAVFTFQTDPSFSAGTFVCYENIGIIYLLLPDPDNCILLYFRC